MNTLLQLSYTTFKRVFSFFVVFPYRSDSVARTYKSTVAVQHPVKDPPAARRDQGCQTSVKRDEEREGVPHHL